MIPTGVGSALTALVGNSLGQRNPHEAKLYSFVASMLNAAIIVVMAVFFAIFRRPIASFYTPNVEIQELYSKAILVALISFCFDCFQGILSRIFIAQGKQIYATITNLVVYYMVLLPLGCLFVLYIKLDIYGIWLAGSIGFATSLTIFLVSRKHGVKFTLLRLFSSLYLFVCWIHLCNPGLDLV